MESLTGLGLVRIVCEYEGEVVEWVTRGQSMTPWLVERGYEILGVVAMGLGMVL